MNFTLWTQNWIENNLYTFEFKETCTSTNDWAKEEAFLNKNSEEVLSLYLTNNQTQGRGRGANTWIQNAAGENLLSSWSFLSSHPLQPFHSALIGLGLYRALLSTWPSNEWSLKAPNDIYFGTKKIAGLLIEVITQGNDHRIIIGLGLNIKSSPKEIPNSTSLVQSQFKIDEGGWNQFIEKLTFEWLNIVNHSESKLTDSERHDLIVALNANPLLEQKYTQILENGSLVNSSGTILWSDL